jgi:hypothetical protein
MWLTPTSFGLAAADFADFVMIGSSSDRSEQMGRMATTASGGGPWRSSDMHYP